MPRITADSVPEHVAQQEAAVIAAAVRLFSERGSAAVGIGDIAREVGLARSSLYRYFPDKAHIVAAWFRVTVGPLIDESADIAAEPGPAPDRVQRWVEAQFRYLTAPAHVPMLLASSELQSLPDDVRAEIGSGHQQLYSPLRSMIEEALGQATPDGDNDSGRDAGIVTMLVASLVGGAAEQVRRGADVAAVSAELRRAVRALIDA